jgi:hypothetical protein
MSGKWKKYYCVRFEVLAALTIFWDIRKCDPLKYHQRFGALLLSWLNLQPRRQRKYFPPKYRWTLQTILLHPGMWLSIIRYISVNISEERASSIYRIPWNVSTVHQTTRRHISGDSNFHSPHHENLKSQGWIQNWTMYNFYISSTKL